ncbi:hypothetical protein B0I18_10777 [Taibaiella chishuiensis]|uniref:Uncharacterized protein n=1 Tax=Taibaiella chishuiensis TaxID=1434707 RepID=A0A2P8D0D1_9BACT|nr:hypothetical protein B0I18_10777 [Taibaiella chishuiensis]
MFSLVLIMANRSAAGVAMYSGLIHEAELLICMEKPGLALERFKRAFSLETPLGKDLLNALICAYQAGDTVAFATMATALLKNGAFSDGCDFYRFFDKIDGPENKESYKQIWKRLVQVTPVHIDLSYRQAVKQLVQADQDVRHYFMDKQTGNYNAVGRDSLNTFDSLNTLRLKRLFETRGFPTEEKIGYDYSFPGNPAIYEIIIRHDRSWTNRKVLDSFFYQATREGKLSPTHYGYWKDQSYWAFDDSASSYQQTPFSHYGTDALVVINDTLYIHKYNGTEKDRINAARKEIYADALDEMAMKANYQFTHKYFRIIDGTYGVWDGMPDEETRKIRQEAYTTTDLKALRYQLAKKYGLKHD